MAEEKETSAASSSLTSLKDLLLIVFRTEGFFQGFGVCEVRLEYGLEVCHSIECDTHVHTQDYVLSKLILVVNTFRLC